MNKLQSGFKSDYPEEDFGSRTVLDDLHLAAELGKTLLERNKQLENALRESQSVIDDQTQEIMYLNKQTAALREVNESRLKIYEQLEISVNDLEIVKHKLGIDYANERKRTKNLSVTVENLEMKNNELLGTIDDLTLQIDLLKKKLARQTEHTSSTPLSSPMSSKNFGNSISNRSQLASPEATKPSQDQPNPSTPNVENKTDAAQEEPLVGNVVTLEDGTDALEEVSKLLAQLRDVKLLHTKEQRKVSEMEEQLDALQQQNRALENQVIKLHQRGDELKSIHDEISLLEEVRKGQICCRCLSDLEFQEQTSRLENDGEEFEETIPEDDDSSIINEIMSATPPFMTKYQMNIDDYQSTPKQQSSVTKNFYKEFVEKYEPLFIDHIKKAPAKKQLFASLEEELKHSGEFNSFLHKDQDYESIHDDGASDKQNDSKKSRKNVSRTPTDFSEAETSSSGFADEVSTTSNYSKSTQTDCILGSLLCSISAGDDCSLGVYNNVDNQLQQKSQYLGLFKEIFTVLKKAAENKDEVLESSRESKFTDVSLSTAASETQTSVDTAEIQSDDTASLQSSTISLTVTLPQSKVEEPSLENVQKPEMKQKKQQPEKKEKPKKEESEKKVKAAKKGKMEKKEKPEKKEAQIATVPPTPSPVEEATPPVAQEEAKPQELVLRPLIRQPLEYMRVERRKRSSSRRKNRNAERSDSPITHIIGSQPINYTSRPNSGRRRRELKNAQRAATPETPSEMTWNGNTLQFWSSTRANISSPTPSQSSERGVYEFKPSVASQEIKKLKSLDKSYAEVLKLGETRKREHHQRHRANKGTMQHR